MNLGETQMPDTIPRMISLPLTSDEFHFILAAIGPPAASAAGDLETALDTAMMASGWARKLSDDGNMIPLLDKLHKLHRANCNLED